MLNLHISTTVQQIWKKVGTVTHIGPYSGPIITLKFLKSHDAGGCHVENHRNRDMSAMV